MYVMSCEQIAAILTQKNDDTGGEPSKKDIYYIYGVLSGYIQPYSRLDLGFGSSSAFGLGRTKSSVSGLYSCI